MTQMNVLRKPITECSCEPMTGWYRDGTCSTEDNDRGRHVVCCEMTAEFLAFSRYVGNDLSTPRPEFGFPGLKPGDHWCLCLDRWKQALEAGCAPLVDLEATHLSALQGVTLSELEAHAIERAPE
ncbi:MAG: DUF2237 family protein [Oligoflexus sp.]|jgi:uncharacterized protein (DUF2237 family)